MFLGLKWLFNALWCRPGLKSFLEFVNELFELHIYTMGTRSYAEAISRHIDPDGKLFKERILSRNESGSFTKKSIQRFVIAV